MMNELRFGWMSVDGGQISQNLGVDFAAQVGLQGVTTDPRDVGYPQISTRGLYSTFGDPTSFTFRDNTNVELYDSFIIDRGAHRMKVGGVLLPSGTQAESARQRTRVVHVYGSIQRERLRGLPARLPDLRSGGYRPW